MENFELRERILNLMDRNLEIRNKQCIYTVKDTNFDKVLKWIKKVFCLKFVLK